MTAIEAREIAGKIDLSIRSHPWMDFEVHYLDNRILEICGGIDLLQAPDIKIRMHEVFLINSPFEWKTDTSSIVFQSVEGEEFRRYNLAYKVEQGNYLFKFTPEDYPEDFFCYFAARAISFEFPRGQASV